MLILLLFSLFSLHYEGIFKIKSCPLPEGIRIKAGIEYYQLAVLLENKSEYVLTLDLEKSFISIPANAWVSRFEDNYAGKATERTAIFSKGIAGLVLYPKRLIKETDEELQDVKYYPWPWAAKDNAEIHLFFKDQSDNPIECIFEGKILKK